MNPPPADAHAWAAKIRADMGWPEPEEAASTGTDSLRALAASQVAESRAVRTVLP